MDNERWWTEKGSAPCAHHYGATCTCPLFHCLMEDPLHKRSCSASEMCHCLNDDPMKPSEALLVKLAQLIEEFEFDRLATTYWPSSRIDSLRGDAGVREWLMAMATLRKNLST